ncbi:protein of unknown function [Methanoculleus bourgensis]|uniref:Uncharacterized protein n=1 Tax=Methanoculleus bourgensis TaxID=83986 RepID=A0A0X3BL67_9EURY|nr:protein of unknown function [Methanoculleus bourgensis]
MVLSDHYLTFVKDQVELLAKAFAHTDVYVRYHPATEISRVFPDPHLKAFRKDSLIDRTALPKNVSIYPVPLLYLPLTISSKGLESDIIMPSKICFRGLKHFRTSFMRILSGRTAL